MPPITNGGPATVTGSLAVAGSALPQFPESGADKAVGLTFPDLTGVKVTDSSPLAITNDGRPKVIIYLAHWCPHCQKEVPLLTGWIADNGMPQGVDLYAVSTGVAKDRGNYPPADWLIKEQFPVPTLADDAKNTAFGAAGLTSFPSFVAVTADGKVAAGRASCRPSSSQVLEAAQGADVLTARSRTSLRFATDAVPAATVILLRDGDDGVEALMVRRNLARPSPAAPGCSRASGWTPADVDPARPEDEIAPARNAAAREALEEAGLALDPAEFVVLSRWCPPPQAPRRFNTWFFVGPATGEDVVIDNGEIHEHSWWPPPRRCAAATQARSR